MAGDSLMDDPSSTQAFLDWAIGMTGGKQSTTSEQTVDKVSFFKPSQTVVGEDERNWHFLLPRKRLIRFVTTCFTFLGILSSQDLPAD